MQRHLLTASEPEAFTLERPEGSSPYVLTCDHASPILPQALGDLGVSAQELTRHIAWDIGIAPVAARVSAQLDACLVRQNYSRLAIDVNRPPGTLQSVITISERTQIPGNVALSHADLELRRLEIFEPYHACIRAQIDARVQSGRPLALCSLHSFTPSYAGVDRPWHVGVLYNRDRRLSAAMLALLGGNPELVVGDNEPYFVSEESDYTVIVHGEQRGVACIEIEIRQDLISHADGQNEWADRLSELLPRAYASALGG
jgi:predicted N-formylglutamate amidohydrolase